MSLLFHELVTPPALLIHDTLYECLIKSILVWPLGYLTSHWSRLKTWQSHPSYFLSGAVERISVCLHAYILFSWARVMCCILCPIFCQLGMQKMKCWSHRRPINKFMLSGSAQLMFYQIEHSLPSMFSHKPNLLKQLCFFPEK